MDKLQKNANRITIGAFIFIIAGFCLWGLISPDSEVSKPERRKLAQAPVLSIDNIMGGRYFSELDKYLADQFPLRDAFRSLNAGFRLGALSQSDVNGLYIENEVIFKSTYPVNEKNVIKFAQATNKIYHEFIEGRADHYYAGVIPDKEYFSNHLKADAGEAAEIFKLNLEGAWYIDIFKGLNLESYYKTDTHWSQDKLLPVMDILGREMGFDTAKNYEVKTLSPFYGVYWGQLALDLPGEDLKYLTNSAIDQSVVSNIEKPEFKQVYDVDAFEGVDGYDVFLSGATPLISIVSPLAETDKELVIFRDSFGSSIAPLFLNHYGKVTLVDLRYLSPDILGEYVDCTGKDVLVLYSSLILNSSIVF